MLTVVPANVDIVTQEIVEMARMSSTTRMARLESLTSWKERPCS